MNKRVQDTMYARASVYTSIAYIARVVHINYTSKHMFAAFECYSHGEIKVSAHANTKRFRESIAPLFMPIGNR